MGKEIKLELDLALEQAVAVGATGGKRRSRRLTHAGPRPAIARDAPTALAPPGAVASAVLAATGSR